MLRDRIKGAIRGASGRGRARRRRQHAETRESIRRREVRNRDWYDHKHELPPASRCRACNAKSRARGPYQWHHVVPAAQGGKYERSNLVQLCAACHERVHDIWGGGLECTGPIKRNRLIVQIRAIVREEAGRG